MAVFKLEEYLPDGLRPSFDAFRTRLLDLLAMVGVLPGGAKSVAPESSSERPDVVKAKSAHSGAEKAVQEAQSKLDETKAVLGKDWGREWEFKKLDGQCFEQESGEWVIFPSTSRPCRRCSRTSQLHLRALHVWQGGAEGEARHENGAWVRRRLVRASLGLTAVPSGRLRPGRRTLSTAPMATT